MSYYVTEDKYSKPDQHDDLDRILKPHKAWNSMKLDANTYSWSTGLGIWYRWVHTVNIKC